MVHLETSRLLLRDHEAADLEQYCEIESDPVYRSPQPVHPRSELERSFRNAWLPPKPMGLLATVYKPEDRYIGRCGLYPLRNDSDEVVPHAASIGFYLAWPFWGRGLATEAGEALIGYGFDSLRLGYIEAGINAENKASIRLIEKLGFEWVASGEGAASRWHRYELRNPGLAPRPNTGCRGQAAGLPARFSFGEAARP